MTKRRALIALLIANEVRGLVTVALTWPAWSHLFALALHR